MDECLEIKNKYNRVKGQIEGIGRMISDKRPKLEIVGQIRAASAALNSLAVELLKEESNACLSCVDKDEQMKKFEELVANFFKLN